MTNPHIEFATYVFGQPEYAAAEFRCVLPKRLTEDMDWSTLKREPDALVDPELQDNEGDLLFSVHLRQGGVALLRMLLKSEKTPADEYMGERLARHAARQLRHWCQQHPEARYLPALIPLVVYFGKTPWNAPRQGELLLN